LFSFFQAKCIWNVVNRATKFPLRRKPFFCAQRFPGCCCSDIRKSQINQDFSKVLIRDPLKLQDLCPPRPFP